jgi:cytochrome c biogenesis protein ResB
MYVLLKTNHEILLKWFLGMYMHLSVSTIVCLFVKT